MHSTVDSWKVSLEPREGVRRPRTGPRTPVRVTVKWKKCLVGDTTKRATTPYRGVCRGLYRTGESPTGGYVDEGSAVLDESLLPTTDPPRGRLRKKSLDTF